MLIDQLKQLDSFKSLQNALTIDKTPVLATGVMDSQKAHLTSAICMGNTSALVVASSELKAQAIYQDLSFFSKENVMFYPSKDIVFYNADLRSIDIEAQRFTVINKIISGDAPIIVLSVEALFDKLLHKETFKKYIMKLGIGQDISLQELQSNLVYMGYEKRNLVEAVGQFAVRGGIIDVFTPVYGYAVRIEFWEDLIDSIRILDSFSQRSIEKIDHITIFPTRALVYGEEELQQAIENAEKDYENQLQMLSGEEAENFTNSVGQDIFKLKEFKGFSGVDRYIEYFYNDTMSLLDYLSKDTVIIFDDPLKIAEHSNSVHFEFCESIINRVKTGYLLPKHVDMIYSYQDILEKTTDFRQVLYMPFDTTLKDFEIKHKVNFNVKSAHYNDLQIYKQNGYDIILLAGTKSHATRLVDTLSNQGFSVVYSKESQELQKGVINILDGGLASSFEYTDIKLLVITDNTVNAGNEKSLRRKKRKASKIESFTDLKIGDYVVHDNHGVGIYKGIEKINVDGVQKDYLKLCYADDGALYVQTAQMDMIQKYIGGESIKIKLHKLGNNEWKKAKTKTKEAVKIFAEELIKLYAKRRENKGFQFSADSVWQREFEDAFSYTETNDQLVAIEEMKHDMESPKVMDRLLCGDVGYGKTEVALRGAFKAVQDGKQVAYLVPTTILAQQHYKTFESRMKDYPINVEMLSRFKTAKEQKQIIKNVKAGLVDIVIGTHRILSKDIEFRDLGLIIVDEEQRFGVSHKEKLKKLEENVDAITLTATPIPRTLHMSLTGARDMSLLTEPPGERQAIQTYVTEYNTGFIRDAVHRELARGGQVYYLHNRVRNISSVAKKIKDLVPEANVTFAHGQMTERELERIMLSFTTGEIDVLVCTTIIETGLDIPNANTIIIQDADYMGLAQLYQLRGRVGRSNKIAYAYLMYKKDKVLQEAAEKRLQAIRDFTEFGSGFKVAMRDLEIRGAGNLLGAEQHGHMEAVGYDMYCKLLDEAIKEQTGELVEKFETSVDVNISAYIADNYIENEEQKLEIYKKIASIKVQDDYNEVQEEIEDKYGDIPTVVQNLLDIALCKAYANKLGIVKIQQKQKNIILSFKHDADVQPDLIIAAVQRYSSKLLFTTFGSPCLTYKVDNNNSCIPELTKILLEMG